MSPVSPNGQNPCFRLQPNRKSRHVPRKGDTQIGKIYPVATNVMQIEFSICFRSLVLTCGYEVQHCCPDESYRS